MLFLTGSKDTFTGSQSNTAVLPEEYADRSRRNQGNCAFPQLTATLPIARMSNYQPANNLN